MTAILIDINTDIDSFESRCDSPERVTRYVLNYPAIWLFSVLIHGVILIAIDVTQPLPQSSSRQPGQAVVARLYQPAATERVSPVIPAPAAPDLSIAAPSEAKPTNTATNPVSQLPPETAMSSTDALSTSLQKASSPVGASGPVNKSTKITGRQALRQFMAQQNGNALKDLAGQQAADFQHRQVSPTRQDTRTSEEIQASPEPRTTQVRCNTPLNSALATLSSWTGGTLRCSQIQANHDEFIRRRQNPETRD